MRQGYIALTSAVMITLIVMTVVFTLSFKGFFIRSNVSDAYFKQIANFLSESCVRTAMLKLAKNPTYIGNETVTINGDSCTIQYIPISLNRVIETKAVFGKATTNYRVTLNMVPITVISWEEIPVL